MNFTRGGRHFWYPKFLPDAKCTHLTLNSAKRKYTALPKRHLEWDVEKSSVKVVGGFGRLKICNVCSNLQNVTKCGITNLANRAPKLEKSNSCMSKTLVNAMFFCVKRLPPGDPCCAQSTAVDNSQRNVDSSLIKTLANAMFFRVRRLPPGGLFSKLRIVDFLLE